MKEFMTLQEFKEYFGIKDNKTVQSWEENGLKAIYICLIKENTFIVKILENLC